MTARYAVMLEVREGSMIYDGHWRYKYMLMTWCIEDTYEKAHETLMDLRRGDPMRKEIRQLYIELREA